MDIPVFIISLEKRQDRRLSIRGQMNELGWAWRFWDADEADNGVYGLLLSMFRLLDVFAKSKIGTFLVLEDDALLLPTVCDLDRAIGQLPESFDLLYLGSNLNERPEKLYSENLINVKHAYASHAIYFSPTGAKKVLAILEKTLQSKIYQPLDVLIVNEVQKYGNCYCTFPLMCSQFFSYSDIEKREVDYTMFIEKRFEQQTKHLI